MDSDQYCTPQKILTRRQSPTNTKYYSINSQNLGTPKLNNINPSTPASLNKKSTFNVFPFIKTPSTPVRFPKVINPFEHALTERLHLPLICSPSLFQPANTPQHSSTQFEWTIEEVSSLGPVNVIPDVTQFQATPDPDLEAKAQAAISSFFQEHQIVPSPIGCALGYQKIILSDDGTECASAGGSKPVRRIRDGIAQTVLTFPPNLPPEIENILEQFYTFNDKQQQTPTVVNNCDTIIDYEAADASLRRKQLFRTSDHGDKDVDDVIIKDFGRIDGWSPPPKSPDLETVHLSVHNSGSSIKNSSFGLLSPISKLDSPKKLRKLNDIKMNKSSLSLNQSDCNETDEDPYRNLKSDKSLLRTSSSNSLYGSTPAMSNDKGQNSVTDMSVDISCFNAGVDRLNINNSVKQLSQNVVIKSKSFSDMDNIFNTPATEENNSDDDDDEMQISQLSSKSTSSTGSSQHPDTPVRKRRSASRKNLSRSFSYHQGDDDDDDENYNIGSNLQLKITAPAKINENNRQKLKQEQNLIIDDPGKEIFGRTDSGFTEILNSQDESKINDKRSIKTTESDYSDLVDASIIIAADVSMVCCSTPSTKGNF